MIPFDQPLDRTAKDMPLILANYCHWFCFGLFACAALVLGANLIHPHILPQQMMADVEGFLIFSATATAISSQTRHLPAQNVFLAAAVIAFIGSLVTWVGLKTSLPFGPFIYSEEVRPQIGGLAWFVPFLWVIAVFSARGVSRLILRPWRKTRKYGYWVIGFTIVLCVAFDMGWEIFVGPVNRYVLWEHTKFPLSWNGVPMVNFLGWILTLILMLAFATPILINKRHAKTKPEYHPIILWDLMNAVFIIAAAESRMWSAVIVLAVITFFASLFAVRGARW